MGRFLNCGQACIAGDHVYVHNSIKTELLHNLKETLIEFYGTNISQNDDIGKIITKQHVKRLEGYLKQNHGGQIIVGGQVFMDNNFIQPTIVADPNSKSSLMTEEIFGPILPVVGYDDLDPLIDLLNTKPKPLAIYCFSEDKTVRDRLSHETSSGAFVVNDVVVQLLNP